MIFVKKTEGDGQNWTTLCDGSNETLNFIIKKYDDDDDNDEDDDDELFLWYGQQTKS